MENYVVSQSRLRGMQGMQEFFSFNFPLREYFNKFFLYFAPTPPPPVTFSNGPSPHDDLFFPEDNTLILNELEQQECGGPLTETECWESLKSDAIE